MVFPFPTNMILPFCQESKVDLLPENTIKDDISGLIEKDDILQNMVFLSVEKLKMMKKFTQSNTYRQNKCD